MGSKRRGQLGEPLREDLPVGRHAEPQPDSFANLGGQADLRREIGGKPMTRQLAQRLAERPRHRRQIYTQRFRDGPLGRQPFPARGHTGSNVRFKRIDDAQIFHAGAFDQPKGPHIVLYSVRQIQPPVAGRSDAGNIGIMLTLALCMTHSEPVTTVVISKAVRMKITVL